MSLQENGNIKVGYNAKKETAIIESL